MRLGRSGQDVGTHLVVDGDGGGDQGVEQLLDVRQEVSILQEPPQLDLVDVEQGAGGGLRQRQHADGGEKGTYIQQKIIISICSHLLEP